MLGVATGLARSAATAARHPVRSTAHAVGFAKGAATSGAALVTVPAPARGGAAAQVVSSQRRTQNRSPPKDRPAEAPDSLL